MARIRSIKPEFPQSESIGHLSRDARLLFIQLWTLVDDSGRARAASRMLASLLYPYDDDAPELIDGWLSELEDEHMVRRYVVDGSTYLEITNWQKHQKIDKPSPSRLPSFDDGSALVESPREPSRALATDLGPRTLDHGPRIEDAASNDAPSDVKAPDAELFDRGKKVLGKSAGGMIAGLLKAKGGSVPLARAAIEQASTKENPREYIGRIINGPRAGPQLLTESGQPIPAGII